MKYTVCTPTYNRAGSLHRVYESLKKQTYRDFEWIVVDDGSRDETAMLIEGWKQEADFPILYHYQENSGKHMALNYAVKHARGELFVIADSDDTFKEDSLMTLLKYWEGIPAEERHLFRGVTCRCCVAETNEEIGTRFPGGIHDVLGIESAFKYHYNFEMWGFNRTEVMREYPFPDTTGQGLAFYPEIVIWHRMGLKYKVRFVDDTLRACFHDQDNATTHKKRNRSKENIFLWIHYINDIPRYFWYDPVQFLKAYVGVTMDGLLLHRKIVDILRIPKGIMGKVMVAVCMPVGYVCYLKRR